MIQTVTMTESELSILEARVNAALSSLHRDGHEVIDVRYQVEVHLFFAYVVYRRREDKAKRRSLRPVEQAPTSLGKWRAA